MALPPQLKERIIGVVAAVQPAGDLQNFTTTRQELLGGDFNSSTSQNLDYPARLEQYINELDRRCTLVYFVKEFAAAFSNSRVVSNFYEGDFKGYFRINDGQVEINPKFLDCILLENALPFIDRDNIKVALHKLLDGKSSPLLRLDGKTKTGLSYIRWYLKEMAKRTGTYQFEYIDLRYVLNNILKNRERVAAYDVAEYLNDKLKLAYKFNRRNRDLFKVTPFITHMKEKIKKRNESVMLYFDHFDNMVSDDVSEFIYELINTSLLANLNCYIFLAGYNATGSWSSDIVTILRSKYNSVTIGSFTREHVRLFFKKVYAYLSLAYSIRETEDTFIESVLSQIPNESFDEPNVETIGAAVANWYIGFQHNNA